MKVKSLKFIYELRANDIIDYSWWLNRVLSIDIIGNFLRAVDIAKYITINLI